MDCPDANLGCTTGAVAVSLGYLESQMIELNSDYPYTATSTNCTYNEDNGVTYGYGSLDILT